MINPFQVLIGGAKRKNDVPDQGNDLPLENLTGDGKPGTKRSRVSDNIDSQRNNDSIRDDSSDENVNESLEDENWIVVKRGEMLVKALGAETWKEKSCIGVMKIRTEMETTGRDDKFLIKTKCSGEIRSIQSLTEDSDIQIREHGASNLADVIVVRLTGKCDMDWNKEKTEPGWNNLGVCEGHVQEIGVDFFSTISRKFCHVFLAKRDNHKIKACTWPKDGEQSHDGKRPVMKCSIKKHETEHILAMKGYHVPLGLPICKHHEEIVEFIMKLNNADGVTPTRLPVPKTPKTNSNLRNQSKKTTTPIRANTYIQRKWNAFKIATYGLSDRNAVMNAIGNIDKLVQQSYRKIINRLRASLTLDIKKLEDEDDDVYRMRVLGRVKFHVSSQRKKTEGFCNICDVFPMQYREFMGEDTEKNDKTEESDESVTEDEDGDEILKTRSGEDVSDKDEERDQFVPGEVANVETMRIPKMSKKMEDELDDNLADIFCPELREAKQDSKDMAKKVTFARLCNDCELVERGQASFVTEKLLDLCNLTEFSEHDEMLDEITSTKYLILKSTVFEWIVKFMPCYQGLRSIEKRLLELIKLITLKAYINAAKNGSEADIEKVIGMDLMPDELLMQYNRFYAEKKPATHHTQKEVEKKFGKLKDAFEKKMIDAEDVVCEVCTQYTVRSEMSRKTGSEVNVRFLEAGIRGRTNYNVCRMCWREMSKGKMPQGAFVNGMGSDEEPQELRCLNNIEKMLIQKVRAIQHIFHLRNINGKKTDVKATTPVLSLVPVAIEETVEHVAITLPSSANMVIHVSTPWDKLYLVSMERIVTALTWLKRNNPHYTTININDRFTLTLGEDIIVEEEVMTTTDVNKMILRGTVGNDDHLLTQADFEVQACREVVAVNENEPLACESYILKKDKYRTLSYDLPNVDELTFPDLFPKGRFGISEVRARPTTMTKMIRHRLLEKNRKYATNANFYAFMYGLRSQKNATSILGVQARLKKGSSPADIRLDDPSFNSTMNSMTAKLRGSPAYWQTVRYNLRAHIINFGNPSFFLTLNSNETKWEDLHELYSKISGHLVNGENIGKEIAKDPTIYSRYWKRRVNAFFKEVLLATDGPLGTITHYFHRVEYQHRGTQHVHCLLWTKNRPAANATSAEITDFLDKYVTARLPSEKDEPELYKIIHEHQRHWERHSNTCQRHLNYRGAKIDRCRFDFPRPVLRRTMYYKEQMALSLPGLNKRQYFLARDDSEKMVNDYNATISLIWNGNTDVQVIMASSTAVSNYITSYTTKGEKSKKTNEGGIGMNISDSTTIGKETFKILYNMLKNRECGGLEIVDDLLGHENFSFDRGHTFIQTDPIDRRMRVLKPAEQLKKLGPNDVPYLSNMLDTYYPNRPKQLKSHSLLNIMINFDVVAKSRVMKQTKMSKTPQQAVVQNNVDDSDSDDEYVDNIIEITGDDYHYNDPHSPFYSHEYMENGEAILFDTSKAFRKRRQTVARFYLPDLDWYNIEIVEDFYRRLCVMFIPWTSEETLLQDRKQSSYVQMYKDYKTELKKQSENALHDLEKIVSNFLKLKNEDRLVSEHLNALKKAAKDLDLDHDMNEEIEVQKRIVDEKRHEEAKNMMNSGQRSLFEKIINQIDEQEKNKKKINDDFQMFVSGTAGVGKSFLINALADELTLRYADPQNQSLRPAVLIAAPTGLAAIGVKGSTIHSLFNIEVQHGNDSPFSAMKDVKRDQKRAQFQNVKLIIIDELSMCSSVTLMKMNCRLQEIRATKQLFGNMNIVAFGDLLQLPPVSAPSIFSGLNAYQMRQIFAGISFNIKLWSRFQYAELVENMRQRDDLVFAELMGRVRLEATTAEDIKVLKSRVIPIKSRNQSATYDEMAEFFVKLQETDPGALALFPTNIEVVEFNNKVMKLRKMDTTRIIATETAVASARKQARSKTNKFSKIWQWSEFSLTGEGKKSTDAKKSLSTDSSPNIAGGLPFVLDVAKGARVMLRRNLDTANGLVNGATGELVEINKDGNNCVTSLSVRFDRDPTKLTEIERVSVYYDVSFDERRSRNQFPIVMAFGATIHKAQGLTLKNVLVSTRNMFCDGQFFVAASRVQNINGLHLGDLHENKITVHTKSLIEYNRLRKSIGMEEFLLPVALPGKEKKNREPDGTVVFAVKKQTKTNRRKSRTHGDENEPTSDELLEAIPQLIHGEEFELLQKLTMYAILLCIVKMTKIRQGLALSNTDDENLTLKQLTLSEVLKGGPQCIEYLMREIDKNTEEPAAMFEECLKSLPENLKPLIQMTVYQKDKCENCHGRMKQEITCSVLTIEATTKNRSIERAINQLTEGTREVQGKCKKCNKSGYLQRETIIEFGETHEYLVVVINGIRNHFSGLAQDGSSILGERWVYLASVHNMGMSDQVCCLARQEGGVFNVMKDGIKKAASKPQLRNLNILVFQNKRYERLRQPKLPKRVEKEVDEIYPNVDEESLHSSESVEKRVQNSQMNRISVLHLRNSGTDCFLICALNLINNMRNFRRELLLRQEVEQNWIVSTQLILENASPDVRELRRQLTPFNNDAQDDADHALTHMLQNMPNEISSSFTVIRSVETKCSAGCTTMNSDDTSPTNRRISLCWYPGQDSSHPNGIASIEKSTTTTRCSTCRAVAQERTTHILDDAVANLVISRQGVSPATVEKFNNPDVDGVITLFGKNWRIKAMSEYRSAPNNSYGIAGHYVTWQAALNGWIEIDDHSHHFFRTSAIINLSQCITFLLEKI